MNRSADTSQTDTSASGVPRAGDDGSGAMHSRQAYANRPCTQTLLRLVICGDVRSGKGAMVGRLASGSEPGVEDKPPLLTPEALAEGCGQSDAMDVVYRRFATYRRNFIATEVPGDEIGTRSVLNAAACADVAILVVDARQGLISQCRRHAFLVSLAGVRHIVMAVNKMDLVSFRQDVYQNIKESFERFVESLAFDSVTVLPISAQNGDNIMERSSMTCWYSGPALAGYLDTMDIAATRQTKANRMVFPVQRINLLQNGTPELSGALVQGVLRVGDEVRVTASGQIAVVSKIVTMDEGALSEAHAGNAVTVSLDRGIDADCGDVLSLSNSPVETTDQFEATVVWVHEDAGLIGRSYDLKLAGQRVAASMTNIKHRINTDLLVHEAAKTLRLNDIAVCNIATASPIAFDSYANLSSLGSFILIDRESRATVGVGMIRHSLRRSQNVHRQALSVTRAERERLNGHSGKVIWFTGLSGSGKSTLANALEVAFHGQGMRTYILDGDNIRHGLNKDLGFTEADRVENIRRIAEVAKLMMDAGLVVMTAFISPFRREREMAKELIGRDHFLEVYVSTPLEVCEQRDVKGLYKQARAGKIPNMTGINSPYEAPDAPCYTANASVTRVEVIVQDLVRLVSK